MCIPYNKQHDASESCQWLCWEKVDYIQKCHVWISNEFYITQNVLLTVCCQLEKINTKKFLFSQGLLLNKE